MLPVLSCKASDNLISLFPIEHYDQTVSHWISPMDPSYDQSLLAEEVQNKYLNLFYEHYFGSYSPWNAEYINQILMQSSPNDLKTIELSLIELFNNEGKPENKIGYGINFRAYDHVWLNNIINNINISQFDHLIFQANNRGIATNNLLARILPTDDPFFYSYKLAGQGYPFDNLQISALWAGTPVYILVETLNKDWMLVVTPDYIGWVKSHDIARADGVFIDSWTNAAKNKLAAITHNQTKVIDKEGRFLFSGQVGSVFPVSKDAQSLELLVPGQNQDKQAVIKTATFISNDAQILPLTATPHHFANLMSTMIGRPYGWGGMQFNNDCSAELKSLFTPFGIWLPRHSSDQVTVAKMVDMSSALPSQRLSYLIKNGQKFLTLVYIGGHVILYIGNYPDQNGSSVAMTYQNIWGLSPNPPARRVVIGKSVIFPMQLQYSEDPSLVSLAAKKYFQVSYLNQLFDSVSTRALKTINIRTLMSADHSED